MSGKAYPTASRSTLPKRGTSTAGVPLFLRVFLNQNDEYREKGNPTPIKKWNHNHNFLLHLHALFIKWLLHYDKFQERNDHEYTHRQRIMDPF